MIEFTIQLLGLEVVATLDTTDVQATVPVIYRQGGDWERIVLDLLKTYIRERGGLTGGIDPDLCNALDLNYALTTTYSIPSYLQLDLQISTKGFEPMELPPPPEGAIY